MRSNALSPLPLMELATGLTPAEPLARGVAVYFRCACGRPRVALVEPTGHATDAAALQQGTNGDGIVTVIRQRHDAR